MPKRRPAARRSRPKKTTAKSRPARTRAAQRRVVGLRALAAPQPRPPAQLPLPRLVFNSLLLAGYAAVLSAVFLPTLVTTYARVDDYASLTAAIDGDLASQMDVQIPEGRPLYDLYEQLTFGHLHTVSQVVALRVISLVALVALAFFLSWYLRKLGAGLWAAVLVPLFVVVMPPLALYQAWASLSPYALAGLVSGAGSLLADRAMSRPEHRWPYLAGAAGCVLVAAAVYQPAAAYFWVFAGARFILVLATPRARWAEVGVKVAVTASGLVLDFLVSLVLPYVVFGHQIASPRTSVATDPLSKLSDFGQALRDSLNMSKIVPSTALAVLAGAVIVAGIAARSRWSPRWATSVRLRARSRRSGHGHGLLPQLGDDAEFPGLPHPRRVDRRSGSVRHLRCRQHRAAVGEPLRNASDCGRTECAARGGRTVRLQGRFRGGHPARKRPVAVHVRSGASGVPAARSEGVGPCPGGFGLRLCPCGPLRRVRLPH